MMTLMMMTCLNKNVYIYHFIHANMSLCFYAESRRNPLHPNVTLVFLSRLFSSQAPHKLFVKFSTASTMVALEL